MGARPSPWFAMYNSYTVQRTQVYLEERQLAELRSIARASGRTVSDVIRDAIDDRLARPADEVGFDLVLDQATGIWAGRDDLVETDALLRMLREDRRGQP